MGGLTYRLTQPLTFDEFRLAYLDDLNLPEIKGQLFDIYGYKPAAVVVFLDELNEIKAQAMNVLITRASTPLVGGMSKKRCHKAERSKEGLWQLTTDGGARFLYFQDSPQRLIVVSATGKMKEKKFHGEIRTADLLKVEYLNLFKEKVKR